MTPPTRMALEDAWAVLNSLADLIEPCDMSHGCRDTVACDREALLALADEMGHPIKQAVWSDCGKHYAPLVREALGVVE